MVLVQRSTDGVPKALIASKPQQRGIVPTKDINDHPNQQPVWSGDYVIKNPYCDYSSKAQKRSPKLTAIHLSAQSTVRRSLCLIPLPVLHDSSPTGKRPSAPLARWFPADCCVGPNATRHAPVAGSIVLTGIGMKVNQFTLPNPPVVFVCQLQHKLEMGDSYEESYFCCLLGIVCRSAGRAICVRSRGRMSERQSTR